jgi:hypothetical protein
VYLIFLGCIFVIIIITIIMPPGGYAVAVKSIISYHIITIIQLSFPLYNADPKRANFLSARHALMSRAIPKDTGVIKGTLILFKSLLP